METGTDVAPLACGSVSRPPTPTCAPQGPMHKTLEQHRRESIQRVIRQAEVLMLEEGEGAQQEQLGGP